MSNYCGLDSMDKIDEKYLDYELKVTLDKTYDLFLYTQRIVDIASKIPFDDKNSQIKNELAKSASDLQNKITSKPYPNTYSTSYFKIICELISKKALNMSTENIEKEKFTKYSEMFCRCKFQIFDKDLKELIETLIQLRPDPKFWTYNEWLCDLLQNIKDKQDYVELPDAGNTFAFTRFFCVTALHTSPDQFLNLLDSDLCAKNKQVIQFMLKDFLLYCYCRLAGGIINNDYFSLGKYKEFIDKKEKFCLDNK